MKPIAIVYTSHTGHTAEYAHRLGKQLRLPVFSLEQALSGLSTGSAVIYLGWLMAGTVKNYRKAAKKFQICAVCGVGLCDTGALRHEIRKNNRIPASTAVFTLQGGMDHEKLQGLYKKMIATLTKVMSAKKNRSADEERMLELLQTDKSYVCDENLTDVLVWAQKNDEK